MKKVLVLATHPDDETLGCGGTLLKHKAGSDKIYWLIATAMKKQEGYSEREIREREKQTEAVKDIYGFSEVFNLGFSAKKLDQVPMYILIENISRVFDKIKPDIIYLPFANDAHTDHRIIFDVAYNCTKTFRYPFIKQILMMETISETELAPGMKDSIFIPNHFVNITDFLDKKLKIMKIFKSEIGKHPFPRSLDNIKALATFRGAIAGCTYAESFMILKEIW